MQISRLLWDQSNCLLSGQVCPDLSEAFGLACSVVCSCGWTMWQASSWKTTVYLPQSLHQALTWSLQLAAFSLGLPHSRPPAQTVLLSWLKIYIISCNLSSFCQQKKDDFCMGFSFFLYALHHLLCCTICGLLVKHGIQVGIVAAYDNAEIWSRFRMFVKWQNN